MRHITAEFVPIESRPFVTIDLSWADGEEGGIPPLALESVGEAVVRVRYTATEEQARRIDHDWIKGVLLSAGAHRVYAIQPTILRQNRVRVEGLDEDLDPMQAVGMWTAAEGLDDAQADAVAGVALGYVQQVPA